VTQGKTETNTNNNATLDQHETENSNTLLQHNTENITTLIHRMKELIDILNQASKAYYAQDVEVMDNYHYDQLYEELESLEQQTGILLSNSPTVKVGYEAVKELPKERHEIPMLSLSKTKSREELKNWLQGKEALLSWKLDGLTIVLTYQNGKLSKAVTRGNGEIGEVVTENAKTFRNLPITIPFLGELILRGEAVITYSDFEKINAQIPDTDAKYKNPRNLCSGSVRQLSSEITKSRSVRFYAFTLVSAISFHSFHNSRKAQFDFLTEQGFDVVPYQLVNPDTIEAAVSQFQENITKFDVPSDGLVLTYEDIAFGRSLGRTAKFPRDSIAFKWKDEVQETILREIEWSASRTGLINPVAVFDPVELEGTTVSRASVHNISVLKGLKLGIGDHILVYKANMIIPQIGENLTKSDALTIPTACPVCGGSTQIKQISDAAALYCLNPQCPAKRIKAFSLFVSRDALNVEGLSEATLEKWIDHGFVKEYTDLFHLDRYKEQITSMEGFGEKSYQNLITSIEKARHTTLPRLLYALGIANIGVATAKLICRHFHFQLDLIRTAQPEELSAIDGIGEIIAAAYADYMEQPKHQEMLDRLLAELNIPEPTENILQEDSTSPIRGKSFVVTGSLTHYASRSALKEIIEQKGGKVTGSVTGNTAVLINNDATSASSKNKKAKELGVTILTEEEFIKQYLEE
jgi:DNA ligase (NAD+)